MFNYAHLEGGLRASQASVREDEPESDVVGITYTTIKRIMTQRKWGEIMQLYVFYAKETKRQKTQQIYATTSFAAKGCGWDEKKVQRVKRKLRELELIEDLKPSRRPDGKLGKPYIRVRFIAKPASGVQNPPGGEGTPQMLTDSKGSACYTKSSSKKSKETSPVGDKGFGKEHPALWKPDPRTKEQKLKTIRTPRNIPSEWEFENFLQDEELDHLVNKRGDLYATLTDRKWHHWNGRNWRKIMDWRRYVRGLNSHIGNIF